MMSSEDEAERIREQSPEVSNEIDNISKIPDDGNTVNARSIVLDKLLDDPQMQEVVVMEV